MDNTLELLYAFPQTALLWVRWTLHIYYLYIHTLSYSWNENLLYIYICLMGIRYSGYTVRTNSYSVSGMPPEYDSWELGLNAGRFMEPRGRFRPSLVRLGENFFAVSFLMPGERCLIISDECWLCQRHLRIQIHSSVCNERPFF